MSYNEKLAERIRAHIALTDDNVEEKKMFGGLCFMVNEKMCVGLNEKRLMVRFDPDLHDEMLEKEGVTPMEMGQKQMKGYVLVANDVLETKKKLEYWLNLALAYNEFAKSSKKKK